MILLDTNVVSESLKPHPSEEVLRWLAVQEPSTVFISAVTEAEILYGVEILPLGKRRSRLSDAVDRVFAEVFADRVLPFDSTAARLYASIFAARKAAGRPISQSDGMIAAITRSHRATLATRNSADFELCGIRVLNPWTA